jgi:hypothetical protein
VTQTDIRNPETEQRTRRRLTYHPLAAAGVVQSLGLVDNQLGLVAVAVKSVNHVPLLVTAWVGQAKDGQGKEGEEDEETHCDGVLGGLGGWSVLVEVGGRK